MLPRKSKIVEWTVRADRPWLDPLHHPIYLVNLPANVPPLGFAHLVNALSFFIGGLFVWTNQERVSVLDQLEEGYL